MIAILLIMLAVLAYTGVAVAYSVNKSFLLDSRTGELEVFLCALSGALWPISIAVDVLNSAATRMLPPPGEGL